MFKKVFNKILNKKKNLPKEVLEDKTLGKYKIVKTHKNNTQLIYFPKNKIFKKFSRSTNGILKIEAEYQGLRWYCKRNKVNSSYVIRKYIKKNNFASLDLKQIDGKKVKSWKTLKENYSFLIKVYNHYKKFSWNKKLLPIHGDLTLDNVIFKKNGIFIIDWEFFKSRKNFKGYDMAYLFLSSACLPYLSNVSFSNEDQKLFCKLWKLLIKQKLNKNMLYSPFNFFSKNIKTDKILRGSYMISRSKFFPFITQTSQKKKILKLINSIKK